MKHFGVSLAVFLGLTACVYQQHGTRFDPNLINQLRPGISTEQDAITILGNPAAVSNSADVITYFNGTLSTEPLLAPAGDRMRLSCSAPMAK